MIKLQRHWGIFSLALLALCLPAKAEDKKAPPPFDPDSILIPEIRLDEIPFDGAMEALGNMTGAQFAVIRTPGTPKNYPSPICLRAKQITLQQFFQFITTRNPDINIRTIDSPHPNSRPIIAVQIDHQNTSEDSGEQTVKVYSLAEAVETCRARLPEEQKKDEAVAIKSALNNVIALINASVAKVPGDAASLQVHEETRTLVLQGTDAHIHAVNQAIRCLQNKPGYTEEDVTELNDKLAKARENAANFDLRETELKTQLQAAQSKIDELTKAHLELAGENERLKVRLEEAAERNTTPKK